MMQPQLLRIRERIAHIASVPISHLESVQLQFYDGVAPSEVGSLG